MSPIRTFLLFFTSWHVKLRANTINLQQEDLCAKGMLLLLLSYGCPLICKIYLEQFGKDWVQYGLIDTP